MTEQNHQTDGRLEHPTVHYEPTDASFRWIFIIVIGCSIFLVILCLGVLWFFHGYSDYLAKERRSPYPLAPSPSTKLPPEPRLEQINRMEKISVSNLHERQRTKLQILNGYGKTEDKSFVHIPIDEAMKHLANKLPARDKKPEGKRRDLGLVDAGESNSGRLFRRKSR